MANITNNYNLNKPLPEENVNIEVLNQNMDIIDTNLKSLSDKINNVENNIPSTDGFVSQSALNTTLASYAKTTDLPEEYDDTELSNRIDTIEINLGNHTVKSDVPENAVFTDTVYDDTALKTELTTAITTAVSDKANSSDIPTKVSQLTNDKGYLTSYDIDTSQNHVHSNKTVLDKITQEYIDKIDGIAEGAEQNVQSDWNAVSGDAFIKNKPEFANVAISGSYDDLVNKPTIPSEYTHPTYSVRTSGLYKITVDDKGHVSSVSVVDKSDITALGIPEDDTVYTHPTTAGNKHIPSGGSSGQILEWSASGTAKWVTPDFGSSGGSGTIYYQTSTPSDATNNSVWIV